MDPRTKRIASTAASVVILAGVGLGFAVHYGRQLAASYKGVIVEKDRRARWSTEAATSTRESERYRHYFVVQTADGGTVRAPVHWRTYVQARVGDPVEKSFGEWYPILMSDEAIERRRASDEALGRIINAIRE